MSLVKHSVVITGGGSDKESKSYFYSEERKYCFTQKLSMELNYLCALRLRKIKGIWKSGANEDQKLSYEPTVCQDCKSTANKKL